MKKISRALILISLLPSLVWAQENPTADVLKINFSPDKVTLNQGGSALVKAKLSLKKGYHVYIGKKNSSSKNIITSFVSASPQFSIVPKKIPTGDSKLDNDNIILKDDGVFELEIFDLSAKQKDFSGSLNVLIKTQVCNDKMVCYKPTTLEEKINLERKGNKKLAAAKLKSFRGNGSKISWVKTYSDALSKAKENNQNVYVVVTAPSWCGACRYLEDTTFSDSKVFNFMNKSFINLYVDYDENPDASKFQTDGVPGNFILDSNGEIIHLVAGAYPPDDFISVFQPYAKQITTITDDPPPPPNPPVIINEEENSKETDGMETIVSEFDEGGRYKVKNVQIEKQGNVYTTSKGGKVKVSMEIKHDCSFCGNAVNQIIVGIGGQDKAQESVWNGKQRSGGELKIVNRGTSVSSLAEDNEGNAEWVKVFFTLKIPSEKGIYYIRTRYAQDYQGKVLTKEGLARRQKNYQSVLGWWKVDRPNGPDSSSNIGAVIVK